MSDKLISEAATDELLDEIALRVGAFVCYASRYYHFSGKDGASSTGQTIRWHRMKGEAADVLGGLEFMKARAIAQVHEIERREIERRADGDEEPGEVQG